MTRFFISLFDRLQQRRWLVWLITIGVGVLCIWLAATLHYQEDISSFLPLDKQTEKYAAIYNKLGGQNKVIVVFEETDTTRQDISENLQQAMLTYGDLLTERDTSGSVRNLQVMVNEESVMQIMQHIWQHYPLLLTADNYMHIDSLLTDSTFIGRTMEQNHSMLMLPTAGILSQSMPLDPLHLSLSAVTALRTMNVTEGFDVVDGFIFTRDGRCGLVFLESPYGISESRENAQLAALLDSTIEAYHAQCPQSTVRISAVGAPLIAVTNAQQIKHDSIVAAVLAAVLILLVLYLAFRRLSDILWIGISIAMGWLIALGCMALVKDSISIIVIGIGSVIIGIAANYPLHFIDHLKHEPNKRLALKDMVQPLLIGNITTVSAFLCLVVLDAQAIQDLGLFGSLMLAGTILFVLTCLPVFIKARRVASYAKPPIWKLPCLERVKFRMRLMPLLLAIVTMVLGYFSLNTTFDADMQHISYMTPSQRSNLKLLTQSMAHRDSACLLYVVADGRNLEEVLQCNEHLLNELHGAPGIEQIASISYFVPSEKLQRERIARWNQLWQQHPQAISQLRKEAEAQAFSTEAFMPFYAMQATPLTVIQPDSMMQACSLMANQFVLNEGNEDVKVVNYVTISSSSYHVARQWITAHLPQGAYAFDSSDMSSHLVEVLSDSFNYIGFVCGFVVFFFLWLSFFRLELSLLSFLPLAVSWIWILGLMDLAGLQFNIVNIILATFIFGQGDDYTIFITEGLIYEYSYGKKALHNYRNSAGLSALIMFIGLAPLLIASHPAMQSLAQVALVGMITVVIMAFYLPPLIFRWLTTRKGVVREYPLTLKRILYSLYAFAFFLLCIFCISPLIYLYKTVVKEQERVSDFIHFILWRFARFVINHVPGTRFNLVNTVGEDFQRPALIICNHQSQLDLMAVLALHSKITILTKEWVWKNPYYGRIIRASEFYPVTNGVDQYVEGMRSMVQRGYSIVVFPEGTRSSGGILRFHKGAFMLAQELELDILPLHLHGFNDVLPRHDFMLREGSMTMEVGVRMPAVQVVTKECMTLRKHFHQLYVNHFVDMCRRYETAAYFVPQVKYKYMYKGPSVERRARRTLLDLKTIARIVDLDCSSVESYTFEGAECGQGELPLIFAKVHPDVEVYAYFNNEDDFLVAANLQGNPKNLHLCMAEAQPVWMLQG